MQTPALAVLATLQHEQNEQKYKQKPYRDEWKTDEEKETE